MRPQEICKQIEVIIVKLIELGISTQQNYPAMKNCGNNITEIGISGAPHLAISMKDTLYSEIYNRLDEARAYHVKLVDGALIQMLYRLKRDKIVAHRLCCFPAPNLENYDFDPESYENDELYADIIARSIVHVPLRFDFNADDSKHVHVNHPKTHLTIGQYPNCRIPVDAPMSPVRFAKFILRNFYHLAFVASDFDRIDSSFKFDATVVQSEQKVAYLVG